MNENEDLPVALVTRRGKVQNTVARTPEGMPDYIIQPISIIMRLLVRTLKVYLSSVLGLLGIAGVSAVTPLPGPQDFTTFSSSLEHALLWAIAPTIVNFMMNALILLTKLEANTPELMG